ncbi:phosphoribosylformylglycinamidine synthase subunit PurL [Candidatus Nephthysia bennettiae]|uniref:phosphoribosylformylglycinamidine synthase subunit PurL n=1 Tax=Candidatus Nephthysia bennettiae TaxID=3127016 RepID=UPI0030C6ED1B
MSIAVDERQLREVALTSDEYALIVDSLGREPNRLELGMLGVLWSEHCSYKTSRPLLRRLPSGGSRVLQGPGENAGAVDVGEGWAVVFKVESHNHPSAIEPYQGAATGVGGILRDVIAMGARPVALLDSLRFGPLPASRHHFEGVVAGVGGYGNCMGVPTVGGEIYFEDCYAGNPLVNAMCVGLVRADQLVHARAEGTGNTLLLVGSQTGRDGIHGASFASLELDSSAEERRPAVQVGNPFLEKCLLEACMELRDVEGVVAVQDLGAAGLTSSVAECAARAGAGARLEVSRVPRRESGMTPYEVMLSESQERMLVVVEKGREAGVREVFARWDLEAAEVGEVTDDGLLVVLDRGRAVARLPVQLLTDGAPVRMLEPQSGGPPPRLDGERMGVDVTPPGDVLLQLLGSPNLGSRRSVFRRYDHMVGGATVVPPGGDAAVIRINGTTLGLALSIDGNGRYCELDPYQGGQIAVVEAARNVVATGARPLAVTDCLNFGNPERPHVYWQLGEAVAGIAAACEALDIPVVSGNVSLYNESEASGSIYPTPVIGMVGLLLDYRKRLQAGLRAQGDFVLLVGETRYELGGSEYLKVVHGQVAGRPPQVDLTREAAARDFVLDAASAGLLRSAHDVAEGGMLVALAECCLLGGLGVRCAGLAANGDMDLANAFFGESQGRYLVSAGSRAMPELQTLARRHRVELLLLGLTGGDSLEFEGQLKVGLAELREVWDNALL